MTINPIQSDLIWYHFFPGEKPALEGGSRGAKPVIHCLRATEMTRLNNENEWRWTRLGIWYAVRDTLVSTDLLIWQDNSGVYASWFMGTKQVVIADDSKMWTNEMDIIRQQEFAFDLVRCCPSNEPMSRTDCCKITVTNSRKERTNHRWMDLFISWELILRLRSYRVCPVHRPFVVLK